MSEINKRIITAYFLMLILIISFLNIYILILLILAVNVIALDEFLQIFKIIFKKNFLYKFFSIFISLIVMSFFSIVIYYFAIQSFEFNRLILIYILSICISTDVGGFIFGKVIGGKKITKISPNKTYAGALGSFTLAFLVGFLFYYYQEYVSYSFAHLFYLIFSISLISQLGDLFISFLKRKANVKDTGNFLPGHGGILDRIDGIIFALPLGIILY